MSDVRNAHLLRAIVSLLRLPCRYSFPNGLADLCQALKRPWAGRDENFYLLNQAFKLYLVFELNTIDVYFFVKFRNL